MRDARELYESIARIRHELKEHTDTQRNLICDIAAIGDLADLAEESGEKYHSSINHGIKNIAGVAEAHMEDIETMLDKIMIIATTAIQEPEAEKGHRPTESELRDLYREPEENTLPPNELTKHDGLLKLLLPAIQATRAGEDVIDMHMDVNADLMEGWFELKVKITFATGSVKYVDVTADSEIAMIVDICKALM